MRRLPILGALLLLVAACGGTSPTPNPTEAPPVVTPAAPTLGSRPQVGPPDATPMAVAMAAPAGDGTTATITTELGDIVIELYTESAPVAATNFIDLAQAGFYDGLDFHRLMPGFVIQGGDPNGDGTGGPGYTIPDETVVGEYHRGTVAMARTSQPDSQGSQFFIVLDDTARGALDQYRTYVIFGNVVSGMDVVDKIAAMPNGGGQAGKALDPVVMQSVTIQAPSPTTAPVPVATLMPTTAPLPTATPAPPTPTPAPSGPAVAPS